MKPETKRNLGVYGLAAVIFFALITFIGVGYYAYEQADVLYWIAGAVTLAVFVYALVKVSREFFGKCKEGWIGMWDAYAHDSIGTTNIVRTRREIENLTKTLGKEWKVRKIRWED